MATVPTATQAAKPGDDGRQWARGIRSPAAWTWPAAGLLAGAVAGAADTLWAIGRGVVGLGSPRA